jgi:replicative DNA helicase
MTAQDRASGRVTAAQFVDEEAERTVLGVVLADGANPQTWHTIAETGVTDSAFYMDANRAIWRAILAVQAAGDPVELITVRRAMQVAGTLPLIGSGAELSALARASVTSAALPYCCATLRDLEDRRACVAALSRHGRAVADMTTTPASVLEGIVRDWPTEAGSAGAASAIDVAQEWIARKEAEARGETTPRIPSVFPTLNRWWAGGYGGRWLTYVGGRPGTGKTAYLLGEALHAARQGVPVWLASLEMSRGELMDRLISMVGGIDGDALQGVMDSAQWGKVHTGITQIANLPLWIDDRPQSVDELSARVRAAHRSHGVRLVCVDYVQLLGPPASVSRSAKEFERLGAVSQSLHALRKALPVSILAAAQLNRNGPDRAPVISDLRGTGQFEQDADCILFPWRPAIIDEAAPPEDAQIIVAKCRSGRVGSVAAHWTGARTTYREREDRREPVPAAPSHRAASWDVEDL